MAENAWTIMVGKFLNGELGARSLLDEGMESRQPRFLGSAYYIVMLKGPKKWLNDLKLSEEEISRLVQAFHHCTEEWDNFELRVSEGDFDIPDHLVCHRTPPPEQYTAPDQDTHSSPTRIISPIVEHIAKSGRTSGAGAVATSVLTTG
ncbi:uncharacterized protein EI90DRAFT_3092008 [Cantharellus anzutake]|uniref:uncharacterized protein n=1 Tax=Cantharellus anzutake TaxID=1750568 RepID=UPI001904783F|nr:uncharacterized protein EI90DRAFT_3092008 [Cantharellus anzutake]KAF8313341.1 hypothetical protein EI90DRAFT_3092008 [Cantharellus anzutake]